MSVMMGDATGEQPGVDTMTGFESQQPAEEAAKLSHLLIDVPGLTEQAAIAHEPGASADEALNQALIALSVHDVMDLGTESVDGLDALVIHGAEGDVVQLTGDAGYQWSRDETITAPAGYDVYQAIQAAAGDAPDDAAGNQPVYVLVQQDMTVVLPAA